MQAKPIISVEGGDPATTQMTNKPSPPDHSFQPGTNRKNGFHDVS